MSGPREIVVETRPVCNYEVPRRCRQTAVKSYDGFWLCGDHELVSEVVKFAVGVPIRWTRRVEGRQP